MLGKSPSTISRKLKRNSVIQLDSSYTFKGIYIADTAHILYKKRRQKCIYHKQYDPLFFVELKQEILKREKRVHSIDTFCNVYKRDNPDKVAPSTKTVYKMIHRGQIEGIKPCMLPRMIKLKPMDNAILKRIKRYWTQALSRDLNILTAVKKKDTLKLMP